jgi:hypothetical protein
LCCVLRQSKKIKRTDFWDVVSLKQTDVSEVCTASIMRVIKDIILGAVFLAGTLRNTHIILQSITRLLRYKI